MAKLFSLWHGIGTFAASGAADSDEDLVVIGEYP